MTPDPASERWPHPDIVKAELEQIRQQIAHRRIIDKIAFRQELKRNMRRDDDISRQRWLADFTHRQMLMGERILRESRKNGGTVTD
jgi:hypothetical protein